VSLLDEDTIHLFNRAYCYLRLSGLSAEESFAHIQNLPDILFRADNDKELWTTLLQELPQQSSYSLHPQPSPAIVRGHMGYHTHGV
jgi:hypothetical protein